MNGLKIIIAFICGFMIAQAIKFLIALIKGKKDVWKYLVKSGDMPSGHAASLVSATTFLGFSEGIDSSLFALAICVTAIVLYDAMNVRYVVGEQGKALNKLIPKPIRIAEGHTFLEVSVGTILGFIIGTAVFYICSNF